MTTLIPNKSEKNSPEALQRYIRELGKNPEKFTAWMKKVGLLTPTGKLPLRYR